MVNSSDKTFCEIRQADRKKNIELENFFNIKLFVSIMMAKKRP
tara:strand:+ start:407 stop:535 length:129 start_codon:yes stop_codon:yes gene_type:complete